MNKRKSQMDLVSLFILIGLSLFFVSATYFWVFPNVQKITALKEIERIEIQMLELHKTISQVSREQSQRVMAFQIDSGNLRIRNDSVLYSGNFKLPESMQGAEAILFGGITIPVAPDSSRIECSSGTVGTLGSDEPVCLLKRGNLELELRYLSLEDDSGIVYETNFITSTRSFGGPGSHQIIISWVNKTISGSNIIKNIKLEIY